MRAYADFLSGKAISDAPSGIAKPGRLISGLFPFQRDITRWALRRGRAAVWADCGLGKSWIALAWARVVAQHTDMPVLILTPLAVARQFVSEGRKCNVRVNLVREPGDVKSGVNVTNYERLHKVDPADFGGVVADESSILKDYTSATRNAIIESFADTPFRLACTATPAPNDHMELGNHAEFLGAMTRAEMLAMFFVHDGGSTQNWRIKGHARRDFWAWVCSWAVSMRMPSDLGYDDDGFVLPPLEIREHMTDDHHARPGSGELFATEAMTLSDQRAERRRTIDSRVALATQIVASDPGPWILWCELNAESEALTAAIPGAVEIRGSQTADEKERRMHAFTSGEIDVLVTKPSIAGWGMNWQHCAHVCFVGIGHSFESWYQAIRRTYRFGQERLVQCHVITAPGEQRVVANLKRKQRDADAMARAMIDSMAIHADLGATKRNAAPYDPQTPMEVPTWLHTQTS